MKQVKKEVSICIILQGEILNKSVFKFETNKYYKYYVRQQILNLSLFQNPGKEILTTITYN